MAAVKTFLPSKDFSSIDPNPSTYASIILSEINDARPNAYPSGIVSKPSNQLSSETSLQNSATAITEPLRTRSASLTFTEAENLRLSFEVLNVLEKYGRHINFETLPRENILSNEMEPQAWIGKYRFLSHVYHHVRQMQPVQLTMPAFPCKSLNRLNKVLGYLPDLGEELALCRLHEMCKDVEKVFAPGAQVNIASDGVLFNDILGITDGDCWDYAETLRAMAVEKGLTTIRFMQPMSLLGLMSDEDINKETYLANMEVCRQDLEKRFGSPEEALTSHIKNNKDTNLTYCGMVKFLESEMEISAALVGMSRTVRIKHYKKVAKKMMQRSEAFTLAIRILRPLDVRLSMHPSSGAAKLSFPLIPTLDGNFQKSPWHSCVAIGLNGEYRCVHADQVRDSHDLVYRYGRPYFYRERSQLLKEDPSNGC